MGFAKVFGEGASQVVVMRTQDGSGNALVTFYVHADDVGTKSYSTVFQKNETSKDDADIYFDAIDEDVALARGVMIRDMWANPQSDAGAE